MPQKRLFGTFEPNAVASGGIDLGAKYRSPHQPRDDIRLQKRLKTAKSQAGPIRVAVASGSCPCAPFGSGCWASPAPAL
eukprot:scaffold1776_cov76-Phaeocystis_antarctica.AAC.1